MENATIETLYETSERIVKAVKTDFTRYLYNKINWNNDLIGIKGARGVGKTTLMVRNAWCSTLPTRVGKSSARKCSST